MTLEAWLIVAAFLITIIVIRSCQAATAETLTTDRKVTKRLDEMSAELRRFGDLVYKFNEDRCRFQNEIGRAICDVEIELRRRRPLWKEPVK